MKKAVLTTVCMAMPLLAAADAGERAKGPGFSIPMVAGYAPMKNVPGATIALVQSKWQPGFFRASIIVTPVPAVITPQLAQNTKECAQTGILTAKAINAELKRAGVVDGPLGKTCQWEVTSAKQTALGTLIAGGTANKSWVVTCNRDPRDSDIGACVQALAGWKYE